jgi:hypothetical protein
MQVASTKAAYVREEKNRWSVHALDRLRRESNEDLPIRVLASPVLAATEREASAVYIEQRTESVREYRSERWNLEKRHKSQLYPRCPLL